MTSATAGRRGLDFVIVDVFADAPLRGNPLAVVTGADELTDPEMASIAREFNQSEITFITNPTRPDAAWRLRSFNPDGSEVTGGHNSLGAWWWLALTGHAAPGEQLRQQLGDASLSVHIEGSGRRPDWSC